VIPEQLDWAHLEWRDGRPFSSRYGDSYFGSADPRAEVREVFLQANDLPNRFRTLQRFSIGETGFGSGLNLLLALAEWRQHAQPGSFLSLLSLEAHPLSPADLEALHAYLDLDDADSAALRTQYPPPVAGLHRIEFGGGEAILTLGFGEAAPLMSQLRGHIDAWFFDGFAPRVNPGLWNTAIFQQVARLSASDATFGTYTASGQVRRDLQAAGFEVHRLEGHGRKRERLAGTLRQPPLAATEAGGLLEPRRVAVVGAGLAGLTAARSLHRRGVDVTLFDPTGVASGASGNPAGVLLPNLHPRDPALNQLALGGLRQTRVLREQMEARSGYPLRLASGVSFQGISAHAQRRVQRLQTVGTANVGFLFDPEGPGLGSAPHLFYPDGEAIDMAALCAALATHLPRIQTETVTALHAGAPDQGVMVETRARTTAFDAVVVANAANAAEPLCPEQAAISTVAGQMTRVRAPLPDWGGYVATGQGYCIPGKDRSAWIGATYRRSPTQDAAHDQVPTAADDASNLRHLAWVPGLGDPEAVQVLGHWAGQRAVVRDRLPLVGASRMDPQGRVLLSLAHGSRGLLYAPLAGEWLADHLAGLVEPLEAWVAERLSPRRLDST